MFKLRLHEYDSTERLWITPDGLSMHTRVALNDAPAKAPDIVLVHGLVVSSRYMRPLIEHLAPHYRVYAPDLPGFGDTEEPVKTLTVPELAESLRDWMDSVELERPLILGNSFGCQISIEFAKNYPSRIRGLVLIGPTVDPEGRSIITQAARWISNALIEPPSLGLIVVRDLLRAGVTRSVRTLRMSVRDRVEDKLSRVPVPVLVVRGGLDSIAPEQWANELARRLPDARQATIPGVGHTTNYSAPLEVARVARLFDKRIDSKRTTRKG